MNELTRLHKPQVEVRESQVPQVEMSKEEQSGQSSWSKADRGRGAGREVRVVGEGGHLKGFASGSEEMEGLQGGGQRSYTNRFLWFCVENKQTEG